MAVQFYKFMHFVKKDVLWEQHVDCILAVLGNLFKFQVFLDKAMSACFLAIFKTNSRAPVVLPIHYGTNTQFVMKQKFQFNEINSVTKCETVESKTKKYELQCFFTQF